MSNIPLLNKAAAFFAPQKPAAPVAQQQQAPKASFANDQFVKRAQAPAPVAPARPAPQAAPVKGPETAQPLDFATQLSRNPSLIWNTAVITPRQKEALADFKAGKLGASVAKLNVANKTAENIRTELRAKGFTMEKVDLKNYAKGGEVVKNAAGNTVQMEIWTHKDGGMVRIKEEGDPSSKFRPQPHVSVSCKYPPDAASDDFNNEAFKLDTHGNPLPGHMKYARTNPETPAGKKFLDDLANATHVNLRK